MVTVGKAKNPPLNYIFSWTCEKKKVKVRIPLCFFVCFFPSQLYLDDSKRDGTCDTVCRVFFLDLRDVWLDKRRVSRRGSRILQFVCVACYLWTSHSSGGISEFHTSRIRQIWLFLHDATSFVCSSFATSFDPLRDDDGKRMHSKIGLCIVQVKACLG